MRRLGLAGFAVLGAACSTVALTASGPTPPFLHLTARPGVEVEGLCRSGSSAGPSKGKPTAGSVGRLFEPIETAGQAVELCHVLHWGTLVPSRDQFVKVVEAHRQNGTAPTFPAVPVKTFFDSTVVPVPGGYEVSFTALLLTAGQPLEVVRLGYRVAKDGWVDVSERTVYLTGPAPDPEGAPGGSALVEELCRICPDLIPRGPRTH